MQLQVRGLIQIHPNQRLDMKLPRNRTAPPPRHSPPRSRSAPTGQTRRAQVGGPSSGRLDSLLEDEQPPPDTEVDPVPDDLEHQPRSRRTDPADHDEPTTSGTPRVRAQPNAARAARCHQSNRSDEAVAVVTGLDRAIRRPRPVDSHLPAAAGEVPPPATGFCPLLVIGAGTVVWTAAAPEVRATSPSSAIDTQEPVMPEPVKLTEPSEPSVPPPPTLPSPLLADETLTW